MGLDLKGSQTTLLELDWFYILGLWPKKKKRLDYLTGLGLILLCIGLGSIKWNNQAEMPLEKHEDCLEVSVKQSVIQSSPTCLGQMFGV